MPGLLLFINQSLIFSRYTVIAKGCIFRHQEKEHIMIMKKMSSVLLVITCMVVTSGCAASYAAGKENNPRTPSATTTAATAASTDETKTPPAPPATEAPAQMPQKPSADNTISEEKAVQIALDHARLKKEDVSFITSHPDFDDGRYVYDIEFYKDMTEYDYEIDAATGEILSFDFDIEGYAPAQPAQSGQISLDQAKQIATSYAGVSGVTFTKAYLDYDDGYAVYEIEFIAGTTEYDVEVDASSGAVREFDAESIYDD